MGSIKMGLPAAYGGGCSRDVVMQTFAQLLDALKPVQSEEFRLESAEETLHCSIVQAVAFAGHALGQAALGQLLAVRPYVVEPALVQVQQRCLLVSELRQSLLEHIPHQRKERARMHLVGHYLSIEQVHDGREVKLLAFYVELCHIGHPFLIGPFGHELAVEQVGRCAQLDRSGIFKAYELLQRHIVYLTLHGIVPNHVIILVGCPSFVRLDRTELALALTPNPFVSFQNWRTTLGFSRRP